VSFTHSTHFSTWSHEADLASCLACPECHDTQAEAVRSVVWAARRPSDDEPKGDDPEAAQ